MTSIRHAFRQILLRPGLAVMVVIMLAVGIGATTAMFSLFHRVLYEPLPVPAADRLVNLAAPGLKPGPTRPGLAFESGSYAVFSYPMFRDLEAEQNVFTGLAAQHDFLANLSYGVETTGGRGALVSGSFFEVMNLQPAVGRLIQPRDTPRVGESNVVVLSHDFWQSRFGGNPDLIGETLTVNGQALTIVGVAPERFTGTMFAWKPQVFVPLTLRWLMQPEEPRNDEDRHAYWLYLSGRLKPGIEVEQASNELNRFYRGVLADVEAPLLTGVTTEQMDEFLERRLVLEPGDRGHGVLEMSSAPQLTLLLGATVLVLLIACVNIMNLLLARGATRAGEMAIRTSVGASRLRLVAQLLGESAILAVLGGLASLPVAVVTMRLVGALVPADLADRFVFEISPAAVLFAACATLVTVLIFGLVPAMRGSHANPAQVMKGQAAQARGGHGTARFRGFLVGSQIALSMLLLVLAGLFTQSLANVARVEVGMDVDSIVSFSVSPLLSGYDVEQIDALYDRITEELASQPGVLAVGSTATPLMSNIAFSAAATVVGSEEGTTEINADNVFQNTPMVSPGLFDALSIPILVGRGFTEADGLGVPAVVIVNETFVRKFDLGADAVGKLVRFNGPYVSRSDLEIIGVVPDAKYSCIKCDFHAQAFTPRPPLDDTFSSLFFYVRGGVDADILQATIPRVIADIDPDLSVGSLTTMQRQMTNNVWVDRFVARLSASFAGLALFLAAIGLYAVLSYHIGQRTREFGLRLALGAQPSTLRAMVMRHVVRLTLIGGLIGLILAVGLGRLAEAMLFGLSGYDPFVLTAAVTVLALVVLGAGYLPARRASTVEPMDALRYE